MSERPKENASKAFVGASPPRVQIPPPPPHLLGDQLSRYDFDFDPAYRVPALLVGVTPRTTYVEVGGGADGKVDDDVLRVRFGPWRLETPLANVDGVELTGDYGYLRTAGPAHLSLADRGVTFATNGRRGVCVRFHEPVRVLDPFGRLRHPGATMTVTDPDRLAAELRRPRRHRAP